MMKNAINRYENLWQEFQYVNGTFDDELEKVDVAEIRELLDSEADGDSVAPPP